MIEIKGVPVKLWLETIEEGVLAQAEHVASLPFIYKHFCLMPDAHVGYGMPVGGVMATKGVIVPNAVGVDIGCGMCAVKTNLKVEEMNIDLIKKILSSIRERIPIGFDHQKERQDESKMPQSHNIDKLRIVKQQYLSALKQIGTLGGGNHFIEIQKDTDGFIWVMIHSGSRNIGLKVAEHYNNRAKKLNALWVSSVSPKADLAFLPFETEEARDYYNEMKYCVDFAYANRSLMMNRIKEVIEMNFMAVEFDEIINIAHNYAAWEKHFGEKVIVHRKGATSAKEGETGIIPGSQGTKSYIVEGLGNSQSFMSCSHGAGRVLSRSKAIKTLNLEEEINRLEKQGIIHAIRTQKDLEEAASAYKNIEEVMAFQTDLVKIKTELSPMAVIKG